MWISGILSGGVRYVNEWSVVTSQRCMHKVRDTESLLGIIAENKIRIKGSIYSSNHWHVNVNDNEGL